MKTSLKIPEWADDVLQALAFWIGYKHKLFRHHKLTEGAIVNEVLTLLAARIKDGQQLKCEESYHSIIKKDHSKNRVDILFLDGRAVSTIMEVKRQQSSLKSIKSDLDRLYKVKQAKPEIRCFLLLVSQKKRPKHFVTTNGLAKRGFLSDIGIPCKVIRVCKAAASFRKEKSAHYVCLVEVQ